MLLQEERKSDTEQTRGDVNLKRGEPWNQDSMNSQGANTAGIHDNVYTADALVRLTGLGSILLEKSCLLNVHFLTSSESGANRG